MSDETSAAVAAYRDAVAAFDQVAKQVTDSSLSAPTPCTEWDVRQLLNHVVAEDLWAPPLFAGRSVDEVAGEIPDDALGDDPVAAWTAASTTAVAAADDPGLKDRTMRLTGREATPAQYLMEMAIDHATHAWDLSAALGSPTTLDPDLVATLAAWFAPQAELWRSIGGIIGPPVPVGDDADAQTKLLADLGRSTDWRPAN
ncbi:MAG: TIGR03086 family metal-binding protein [Mycobacteriales bacterium]